MTFAIDFGNDGGVDNNGRLAVFGPPGEFLHTGFKATMEFYASQAKPGLFAGYGFGTSADLHCNRADGTVDAPTAPASGSRFVTLAGRLWDTGTGDFNTSSAALLCTTTAAAGVNGAPTPCKWTLEGTKTGGAGREVWWTAKDGNLDLGCADSGYRLCVKGEGSQTVGAFINAAGDPIFYTATANCTSYAGESNGAAMLYVRKRDTGRSANFAGTVNAVGSDYGEWERRALSCGPVEPGQVIGFNARGQVTDHWREAVSFGVKSTSPSFVGGDKPDVEQDHEVIAYCGKVPVNVWGAKPGQYIVPVQREGGGIKGVPVRWKLWRKPVGQVRRILPDGRAEIAVSL